MDDKEKEKFREHMNKFSREQLVGWLSALSFILSIKGVNKSLESRLLEMFNICDDVIDGKG